MRITKIESIPLRPLALRSSFSTTNVLLNNLDFVIVRIETDQGIVGYGEALPAWEVTGETQSSVMGCVNLYGDASRLYESDLLMGKEFATLDDVRQIMNRLNPVDRPSTVMGNSAAKAAIEQALLDACSRLQGRPIHQLLGQVPTPVSSAITLGIQPIDATIEWLDNTLRLAPFMIRLKVGGDPSINRDVTVVQQARSLISSSGHKTILAADANEGFFDAARTIEFCKRVEGCLDWLEQPTAAEDRTAFREIRKCVNTPLMADESLHSYGDAQLLLKLGGVDYFNVKLMKSGGLLSALSIIDLASQSGVRCHIGSMIETTLGSLMGYYAARARWENVVSTDLLGWDHLADEPWGLLAATKDAVELRDKNAAGTQITDYMIDRYRFH